MKEQIGARIKLIRKELGLNMVDFGKLFTPSASKGVVSNWENNYNLPNNERLKRIAELGGISVPYLFEGTAIEDAIRSVQNRITAVENQIPKLKKSLDEIKDKDELERISTILSNSYEAVSSWNEKLDMLKLIQDDVKSGKTIENLDEKLKTLTTLSGNFQFEQPLLNSLDSKSLFQLPEEIHEKEMEKYNLANMLSNDLINYKGIKLTDNDKKLVINVLEGIKTQFENYK